MTYSKVYMFLYGRIDTDGRVQRSIRFLKRLKNVTIHLVSCGDTEYPIDGVTQTLIKVRPCGLKNYAAFWWQATRIIQQADSADTLFYLHDYYSILLAGAVRRHGGTYIYDAHELLLKKPEQHYTLREKLFINAEKRHAAHAYRVIAANGEREAKMKEVYGLTNTLNILNIADYPYLNIAGKEHSEEEWIVYQGVITPARRLSVCIRALKHLPANCKLLFIGGDAGDGLIEQLKQLAEHEGVAARVRFTGRVANKDMMELLKSCKLGIISYPFDTYNNIYCSPNKLYEYTALGMPVLSTKQPFLEEVITKYAIGGLYDFDDPKSFADAAQAILRDFGQHSARIPAFIADYNIAKEEAKFLQALSPILPS